MMSTNHSYASKNWETSITETPDKCYDATVASIDEEIFYIGGRDANDNACGNVSIYNTITNTWRKGSPMPSPRYSASAGIINGKIFITGGYSTAFRSELEVYNPSNDTWETKAPMPTKRTELAIVTLNDKLYCIGGFRVRSLATVECYDPQTNTWETKPSMNIARRSLSAEVVNENIYVIGGWDASSSDTIYRSVEMFNPDTNTWTEKSSAPSRSISSASIKILDCIYIHTSDTLNERYSILKYNTQIDSWEEILNPPINRKYEKAVLSDNNAFLIGGIKNGIQCFDIDKYSLPLSLENQAEAAVEKAEISRITDDISYARTLTNALDESPLKISLQSRLNAIAIIPDNPKPNEASTTTDFYIKSLNTLSLSINTSSVSFDNYNGIDNIEAKKALNISIFSSLPYSVYLNLESLIDSGNNKLPTDILGAKNSDDSSFLFFNNLHQPIKILDNWTLHNNASSHFIDFILVGKGAIPADIYKTSVRIIVEQI